MDRLRILTVLEHYLPGAKSGGPVRSIGDLVARLSDTFQFDILARDRDLGDRAPYAAIQTGVWCPVGKANVRYLAEAERTLPGWRAVLGPLRPDVVYLNSVFARSTVKILLLRRLGLAPRAGFVLAPRCELHPGALAIKRHRKRAWLSLSVRLRLYERIVWQAATQDEWADIRRVIGSPDGRAPIVNVARHLTQKPPDRAPGSGDGDTGRGKQPGHARIVFVSRITRKKNLDYGLQVLAGVRGHVEFDIYGPIEDGKYWAHCQSIAARMPPNVSVRYRGRLELDDVVPTMEQYHMFLFPTRGESFGHVAFEALVAGCPLLISDQAPPWRGVEAAGAGWVVPLDQPGLFRAHLDALLDMDEASFTRMSRAARAFGVASAADEHAVEANRRLFREAIERERGLSADK